MSRNMLVLGARPDSIGDSVAYHAVGDGWWVATAGVTGETYKLPLDNPLESDTQRQIDDMIKDKPWHTVLCTVGVNAQGALPDDAFALMELAVSMRVNVLGPLAVLERWMEYWRVHEPMLGEPGLHFAFLSSNSARVPRSTGLPYCASKAALSMAVQCTARHVASSDKRTSIYAYEPGWVADTPMSDQVLRRLDDGVPLSRTPGGRQLSKDDLSKLILHNFNTAGGMLNGCLLRIDGGES